MNVLVVGKAKTGTTAVSKAIEQAVRAHYGEECSYHLEPKDVRFFVCGDWDESRSRVVKIIYEHWNDRPRTRNALVFNELPMKFDKKICIVRDPRDEIISRMMYIAFPWVEKNGFDEKKISAWCCRLKEKEDNPHKITMQCLSENVKKLFGADLLCELKQSTSNYSHFIAGLPKDAFVLRYEDFVVGDKSALENYIGLQVPDDFRLDGLERTRRSARAGNWKEFFLEDDLELFRKELGSEIEKLGYDDWKLCPKKKLDSAIYSEYVSRLATSVERR